MRILSSSPEFLRKSGALIAILGFLGTMITVPRSARASSGNTFFETMGISIAVGTVLGASTLPFYDQPGKHVANLAYGAGAGAVVGLGVLAYGLFGGSHEEGWDGYSQVPASHFQTRLSRATSDSDAYSASTTSTTSLVASLGRPGRSAISVHPDSIWTPLVSLTW